MKFTLVRLPTLCGTYAAVDYTTTQDLEMSRVILDLAGDIEISEFYPTRENAPSEDNTTILLVDEIPFPADLDKEIDIFTCEVEAPLTNARVGDYLVTESAVVWEIVE